MNKRILTAVCALITGVTAIAAAPDFGWQAKWITKAQCNSGDNSWIAFRKTVNVETVPQTVTTRIAADTKYWLWINGEPVVFEGGLKRGPNPSDTYYDELDLAPFIKQGDNLISILLWHLGKNGFSHLDSGTAGLLFEAHGDGLDIVSDSSWQANELPAYSTASTPVPNYRLPESSVRFDAGAYPFDWFKGVRPKKLGSALELPFAPGKAPFGALVRRPIPLWRFSGIKQYESIEVRGDTVVCTLPYNCHITPWLKLDAPEAGMIVRMETDHAVVTKAQCVRAEYVTKKGPQEYEHLCWMNGEKVYYIFPEGACIGRVEVGYRESGYDVDLSGSFTCDDPMLNAYWQKAQRTLKVCMRDTWYDCPDRERAQWVGDACNELGASFYALSPSARFLAQKGQLEMAGWQKPDGSIYGPVPAGNWTGELPMQSLAAIGWYGARCLAYYADDYSFVPGLYPAMHRYLHETWQVDEDGLPIYRTGGWDWPDAGENQDKWAQLPPWYYLALKAEKEFAEYLGYAADAAEDEAMMKRIAEAYNRIWWNGEAYKSAQHEGPADDRAQALAVVSGIAGADKYPAIIKTLGEQAHATTYMFKYVLEALYRMGRPDMAVERMRRFYPTIMKDDCSTLWEHWDYDGTCNHAWTGSGIIVAAENICGVTPLEAGFRSFRVAPALGPLKKASCAFDTVNGRISVDVEKKGRKTSVQLSVPAGCTAVVPTRKGDMAFTAGEWAVVL